jgi:serine/threonine-protein kinase
MTENPNRQFGNYEILGRIGKGGMAEVFRARVLSGPRIGQNVAIKRLLPGFAQDPSYLDQFTSEADVSRYLDHPNIVKVHEAGVHKDVYFIAMEWIDGCDLSHIVRRLQHRKLSFPIDFAVYLVKVLLEALAYAHRAVGPTGKPLSIVHCDVSPSNLFISRTGEVKLGDFGVARSAASGGPGRDLAGKPYYLSPELIDGLPVTPAADLWAASVTLFELLTLERPFNGASPDEVFAAIRRAKPEGVAKLRPTVSPVLAAMVKENLAKLPQARFASAEEFSAALSTQCDERIGTPLAIAAVVRGLFGPGEQF